MTEILGIREFCERKNSGKTYEYSVWLSQQIPWVLVMGIFGFLFQKAEREKRKKCTGVISPITDYLNSCPFQICPDFVGRIARQH